MPAWCEPTLPNWSTTHQPSRIYIVAPEIGDGLGFDVPSFDDVDESEKLLEVKTTGLGKFFPFYVSGNEGRCSEDVAAAIPPGRPSEWAERPANQAFRPGHQKSRRKRSAEVRGKELRQGGLAPFESSGWRHSFPVTIL